MPVKATVDYDPEDVGAPGFKALYPSLDLAVGKLEAVRRKVRGNGTYVPVPLAGMWTLLFANLELESDRKFLRFMGYPAA